MAQMIYNFKKSEMKKEEIKMELDYLKLIAESYGFELVEKKREIKVGDFGKFWDNNTKEKDCAFGFLTKKDNDSRPFELSKNSFWVFFAHLTEEEKAQITENW